MPELTRIDAEELAYCTATGTHWGSQRKGSVRFPDGKIRRVTLGIPDTYFSIPGHDSSGRKGWVSVADDGEYEWNPSSL